MVCCWVHSSVATTNEWINLSELHSALPIQRPVRQREEEKTYFSPPAVQLYGLWFQTKNLWFILCFSISFCFSENLQRRAGPRRIIKLISSRFKHNPEGNLFRRLIWNHWSGVIVFQIWAANNCAFDKAIDSNVLDTAFFGESSSSNKTWKKRNVSHFKWCSDSLTHFIQNITQRNNNLIKIQPPQFWNLCQSLLLSL